MIHAYESINLNYRDELNIREFFTICENALTNVKGGDASVLRGDTETY